MYSHAVKQKSDSSSFSGRANSKQQKPFFSPRIVQPKLTISPVDDPHEHEADAVADKVMRMTEDGTDSLKPTPSIIQRKCDSCEKEAEEKDLRRKEYQPNTQSGKQLLVHELTHVVQKQGDRQLALKDQKTDHDSPDCDIVKETPSSERFFFIVNTSDFKPGEEARLKTKLSALPPGTKIDVLGIASSDGPASLNKDLSCERGTKVAAVITGMGLIVSRVAATGGFPGSDHDDNFRAVAIGITSPPVSKKKCGPDITDWFINQINAAKADPLVLALKARLAGAERVASSYGFSAMAVAEGGVAKKVLAEEAKAGSPTRSADAQSQITASVPGQREFGRAAIAATVPLVGAPEAIVLAAIKGAATTWKNLVGTGKKYDFKNRSETLKKPQSANCPVECSSTITLCPAPGVECFVKDVPGNLFYAHIGNFVGWSELILQLGSQFAQLESSAKWDPPEDTRMIHFGFNLPVSLTKADLCSLIQSHPGVFDVQSCPSCTEVFSPTIV